MNRRVHASDGFVILLGVLIVGVVSLSMTLLLINISTDSQRSTLVHEQSAKARGLVLACGEEALQQMQASTSYVGTGNLTMVGGSCTYTVTNTGGTNRTITISGSVGSVVRKAQAYATIGTSISITSWQDIP